MLDLQKNIVIKKTVFEKNIFCKSNMGGYRWGGPSEHSLSVLVCQSLLYMFVFIEISYYWKTTQNGLVKAIQTSQNKVKQLPNIWSPQDILKMQLPN